MCNESDLSRPKVNHRVALANGCSRQKSGVPKKPENQKSEKKELPVST